MNLYVGAILFTGIVALIYHDMYANRMLLRDMGIGEAERLTRVIFDQIYTSMRLGGGRAENRAVIERIKAIEGVDEVRLIHGAPVDRDYGTEEDELASDEAKLSALHGNSSSVIEGHKGYGVARHVMPVFIREACVSCHAAPPGSVAGAISVRVSLKKYETALAGHRRDFLFWGGSILVVTFVLVVLIVNRRLVGPVERLKRGADALASGNLNHRVALKTGDELQDLSEAFDDMAASLFAATKGLKETNEKYVKLVETAADAIFLKEAETGRFVDANTAATVMSGYAKDELCMLMPWEIYPDGPEYGHEQVFKRWVYDGKGFLHDGVIKRKDGAMVPVDISASVVELAGRLYVQEIWRDITEQKGLEGSLRRYVAELETIVKERTAELNGSLLKLQSAYKKLQSSEQMLIQSAKLVSLGEMGAGIAHELNSPIAGVLSIAEVLLGRTKETDPSYYLLVKIKDAAVRSKYIILDMLTYARPFRGEVADIYVNEAIRSTMSIFVSELKTGSIDIVEDLDPNLPRVRANKGQIMEMTLNIIKNAKDAVKERGKIYISTYQRVADDKRFAVIEIKDTGPGIPDGVRDRMFDPFFTTKEKGGGLNIGLGLSIAQAIAKDHGGAIEAENAPPLGASFRIILPVIGGRNDDTATG